MSRINKMWIGTIAGIVVPFIGLLIYHEIKFSSITFKEFILAYQKLGVLTNVISLAVISNLAVFFTFLQFNQLKAARGVVLATLLFAIGMVIMKFV